MGQSIGGKSGVLIYERLFKKGAFRFLIRCVLRDLALSIASTLNFPGFPE